VLLLAVVAQHADAPRRAAGRVSLTRLDVTGADRPLTNRSLRTLIAGLIPGYSARHMTYDLRRLRRNGLIARVAGTHRYQLTPDGRRLAVFFTKTYTRILCPALAELDPQLPAEIAARSPLAHSWRAFERALDHHIAEAALT